ncbi:MAG: hypothetical protein K9J06_14385 [Flavobacteriales bacterium]|nr:hypothetical protein [Flavobacteriales bacterium]
MNKLYRYLFYRAFDLIKLTGNYDIVWGASHFLALFVGITVLRILFFFEKHLDAISMGGVVVAAFIISHGVNYFFFVKKDKYKNIIEYYDKESKRKKIIGRLVSIAVVTVLLGSLF